MAANGDFDKLEVYYVLRRSGLGIHCLDGHSIILTILIWNGTLDRPHLAESVS